MGILRLRDDPQSVANGPPPDAVAGRASGWQRPRLYADRPAVALVALGMAFRLWLTLRGWPALDSDEAIVGLMARHILDTGERPIFFYGQHYMGALDAYLAAGIFRLIGPGTLGLRLLTLLLTCAFLIGMYRVGRAAYTRAVGRLTLALLAIGPAFGLLRELPAIGGYQETLLLGALLPLLVYYRLRRPLAPADGWRDHVRCLADYAVIGLLAGLGIWSDELLLPFVVVAVGVLLLARWREALGFPLLALAVGAFVGGAPFWMDNAGNGGQTFAELSQANVGTGHRGVLTSLLAWAHQLGSTLTIALPTTMGSPHVCVASGAVYADYMSYPSVATSTPENAGCALLNGAYSLAILAVFVVVGVHLCRFAWLGVSHRAHAATDSPFVPARAKSDSSSEQARREHAAMWLRAMLLACSLLTLVLYSLSARTTTTDQFVVVRYLLPLYVALPLVVGCLWQYAAPLLSRITARMRAGTGALLRPPARSAAVEVAAASLLALLALFFVTGAVEIAATVATAASGPYALPVAPIAPVAPADARLIGKLEALGVSRYYANYWTCYKLVFESGEHLQCSTLGRAERYPPYAAALAATRHPAYILAAGSAHDHNFATYIASQGHPHVGYMRIVFDGYAIYYVPGGQAG